ncbi:hypothetical protein AB0C10_16200 [Microbispora amethystogenes]|uniref:hypothetical protein n=1 Tax=Microbispora amethystogenes TaxID=1427754 RepID=UPI0033D6F51D
MPYTDFNLNTLPGTLAAAEFFLTHVRETVNVSGMLDGERLRDWNIRPVAVHIKPEDGFNTLTVSDTSGIAFGLRGEIRITTDVPPASVAELGWPSTPARLPQRTRSAAWPGPCGCECSSGGFCGGCGHAGCGRRR